MAEQTDRGLLNALIYSVYVRSYGLKGTFREVAEDVERIRDLGTDIVWLMPIHLIGKKNRKGSCGCPYSIQDYRKVNPEYGTLEDFRYLVERIHECDMKCMIDVVYNHTSWDSVLQQEHPEFFYRTPEGNFGNRAGEWEDVIDLDYENQELWEYQIESLKYWVSLGVDGFRCDVASMVPVEFWKKARAEVEKINSSVIWLAESVHRRFIKDMRQRGFTCASDGELYQAFDITYDYDIRGIFEGYLEGKNSLSDYLECIEWQETTYPENYIKLRFLENHDQPRAAFILPDRIKRNMWTAWNYLLKGTALLYNGQECANTHTPSLFDPDKIEWAWDEPYIELLKNLAKIKKDSLVRTGIYSIRAVGSNRNVSVIEYRNEDRRMIGIFNLELEKGMIPIDLPDGIYKDMLSKEQTEIKDGRMALKKIPLIFDV